MQKLFKFQDKKRLTSIKKYLGKPPCEGCIVQPMCFSEGINEHRDRFEVYLENPCDEAVSWFKAAEALSLTILILIKENSPILKETPEELMKRFLCVRKYLGWR